MQDRYIGNHNEFGDGNKIQSDDNSKVYIKDKYLYDWSLKSLEKTFDFSTYAIKCIVLLNGSACIAILAFVGDLLPWIKSINCILFALGCFVVGCLLAGICCFLAYLAQQSFTYEAAYEAYGGSKEQMEINSKEALALRKRGNRFHAFAIGTGFFSVFAFVAGVISFSYVLWNTVNLAEKQCWLKNDAENKKVWWDDKILDTSELTDAEKMKVIKVLKK